MSQSDKPIIILGAGGHASVLVEMLLNNNKAILGFVAPQKTEIKNYPQCKYLGRDQTLEKFTSADVRLVCGLGAISVEGNLIRRNLFTHFKNKGFIFETLIHPNAVVASTANIGEGCVIMAGVILQPNVILEKNIIINTKSSVDHDCHIQSHVHIAPGCTLSGAVVVGENTMIGMGANIIQGVNVGNNTMIRAGSLVVENFQSAKVDSDMDIQV